mmetsp:Transcript_9315/g.20730  ORF Transcript_9315/g.20730 Transcript_9315/m.20730 type:complete len:85 (+) Transcript_9315:111-365(+)
MRTRQLDLISLDLSRTFLRALRSCDLSPPKREQLCMLQSQRYSSQKEIRFFAPLRGEMQRFLANFQGMMTSLGFPCQKFRLHCP